MAIFVCQLPFNLYQPIQVFRFESTTDEQWDLLAAKVRQEITEEEFETMVDRLTDEFAKSVGENAPLLSDYAISL